jgi:glycosyltransferase involved in cell wall biosynthesis
VLHVLHVIDGLGLGGAERMLVDIANQTVANGHRVSVCVTRTNTTLASELDPRIELLVLSRRRRLSPFALLRLAAFVRSRRVDVIHAHMRSNLAFVLPLRMARLVRVPIVFHDHYGTIEIDRAVPRWFRIGHRYVAIYVGVYEALQAWAKDAGMPAERTRTIPNGLDLSRLVGATPAQLRETLHVGADKILVVMVATLRKDKAIELLLDAVAVSRHRDEICVIVVGTDGEPPYAERCRARCSELGLDAAVRFIGGRTDVPSVLACADVAVLTSHTESGPLVLVEYLAAGLPIVSTKVGDIGHRLAAMGVPGFVPASDPHAFVTALDALLALSPAARRERGALGKRLLTEGWDIRQLMPRWYEVYRSVVSA